MDRRELLRVFSTFSGLFGAVTVARELTLNIQALDAEKTAQAFRSAYIPQLGDPVEVDLPEGLPRTGRVTGLEERLDEVRCRVDLDREPPLRLWLSLRVVDAI